MSTATTPLERIDDERSRKRVRKGTRSCWECKRRKVRCQFSSDSATVCAGCFNRGTTCLSQEHPEEYDSSSGANVGERLRRVELLLEALVNQTASHESQHGFRGSADATNSSINNLRLYSPDSSKTYENALALSLFDNAVVSHHISYSTFPGTSYMSAMGSIRQKLCALLPSQHDADLICASTNAWMLVFNLYSPSNSLFNNSDPFSYSFNLASMKKQHPTIVARTLLYMAICIGALPPEFESERLQSISSLEVAMHRYLSTVVALVTSDDEQMSTHEGLECLSLQGLFEFNTGNLRRAWLTFRRAMGLAQLMGLHRVIAKSNDGPNSGFGGLTKSIWRRLFEADRFLSLHLRLPFGTGTEIIEPEEFAPTQDADPYPAYRRKMCIASWAINELNQGVSPQSFAATLEIDEKLDKYAKDMPQSWWEIPHIGVADRSIEAAERFERIIIQMWHFQLKSFLHLPFMLRATTEPRYEYNRSSALSASREIILRYLALREANNTQLNCRVADFATFIATITIVLGFLDASPQGDKADMGEQEKADRKMVQQVIEVMESLSHSSREKVAAQSVEVIKALLTTENAPGGTAKNLRLTLPFFGAINICRGRTTNNPPGSNEAASTPAATHLVTTQNQQGLQIPTQRQTTAGQHTWTHDWQGLSSEHSHGMMPAVSCSTNQVWPWDQSVGGVGGVRETDVMHFEGLLDMDTDGNWML
ncbi:hypothetical protein AOQ84DRAFT_280042 [Glonium stellatum]|uniref:Zn(2)-C6 fungal-type domain-containing protein n=1 Tax=Glonium stellatum TaxID=574774 RepID=A0A8E2JZI4_9PEZI|nr:hypothetical protein AOQ84DRAFT_280042 [Glonium stellatum]